MKEWNEKTICTPFAAVMARRDFDFDDENNAPMFEAALEALGPLGPDEMYGFAPMLAMGGAAAMANLRKLNLGVHLDMIKECAGVRLMTD